MLRSRLLILVGAAALALPLGATPDNNGGKSGEPAKQEDKGKQPEPPKQEDKNKLEPGKPENQPKPNDPPQPRPDDRRTETRLERSLIATPAGMNIRAEGNVEVRMRDSRQRFKVEIETAAADGATFLVAANGITAGSIVVQAGFGELELDNKEGAILPPGLDPVTSITMVTVSDSRGNVVLEGRL